MSVAWASGSNKLAVAGSTEHTMQAIGGSMPHM
jgi:hypothetical protein